ncbi:gamma-aminobutyraldehyde dehydrogenase [Cryptosporangium aurantiacum]|uniref:Betaine-aldehyde dehydrogenase n=1 Tax=Cryptosporangium aurantiacum TaxID=134849 RepID=A0A1M7I080_9ACTN|nr:gamma-aminobutyraldehyde dehydrogenase [Cryptosporangium aurantiacum]SHM33787.1 betaine-aldehyde dehydrogenase [Cryptosporangium aurantiacum]
MHQYIAGQRSRGSSGNPYDVIDPSTGETVETVELADADDVDRAVAAASTAFGEWSRATPGERSAVLTKLAGLIEAEAESIAELESKQTGKPIRLSGEFDVPGTIDNTAFFAGAARELAGKAAAEYSPDHTSMVRREPIGVVGSIAPWNYPLQMAAWKVLPAIAAGNTIVLKPAENTPLTSLRLAELVTEAGAPAGVVNVITGTGPVAGEALISHRDVAMVSFTGSSPVGRRVMELASGGPKRIHLELGGKAPFVVLDDADLEAAAHGAVAGALINTGQDCTAATRAYVHRSRFSEFVDRVAELMAAVRLGAPLDPATDQGPLIHRAQQERVAGFVDRARGYGARVVVGGEIPKTDELIRGSYYAPTLIVDVPQDAEIVQREIFGPVLVALPFGSGAAHQGGNDPDLDEAIALANDTPFGLAASVWTRDVHRAMHATRAIRSGCVWVNDHIPIISEMPHGGVKASGFGKDMSSYSFEEYTAVKHVMYDLTATAAKPWHRTVFRDAPPNEPHPLAGA